LPDRLAGFDPGLPALRGSRTNNVINPYDPPGTVRQGPKLIAVRAYSLDDDQTLGWYIFDLGSDFTPTQINMVDLNDWPVVYQPPKH
jgi:hypothetical protein